MLTVGTGMADAVSILRLGHVFVANMTGNVAFLGFALAGAADFSLPGSLVASGAFLAGAALAARLFREFTPALLAALEFRASTAGVPLLDTVAVLRQLNQEHRRIVPEDTSEDFVPARWRPYVTARKGKEHRRYWELCLLNELRVALRAGDIWVVGSRRYTNPETYLIPPDRWPALRPDVVALVGVASAAEDRLDACQQELTERLGLLAQALANEAARQGFDDVCTDAHAMLLHVHAGRADGSVERRLASYTRPALLVIDDFGLKPLPPMGAADLYDIINGRDERGSIILTSNRAVEEWPDLFGDPLLAGAGLDRLAHGASVVTITGKSFRLHHHAPPKEDAMQSSA